MVQPAKLDQERIVREAVEQMREGSLESVSLRKVASRLNARAPSLARHVGDKQRLLALMSSRLFGEAIDAINPELEGEDWLLAFGRALRQKQSEFADISALIAAAPSYPDIDSEVREKLAGKMAAAGLAGAKAREVQLAIQALVTGWMVFENSQREKGLEARTIGQEQFEASLSALIRGYRLDD